VKDELPKLPAVDQAWLSRLAQLEAAEATIVADRSVAAVA
jgi:hypothetical protein